MAAQLTFVQIYNPAFMRNFGVGVLNGSVWTIAVELQFYALTPVLAWLCLRRRWSWPIMLACGVACNLLMVFWHQGFMAKLYSVSFPPWFYMFMLGAWLSTRPDCQRLITNISVPRLLGAFVLVSAAGWALGWHVMGNDINPLSYVALTMLIFKLAVTNATLSNRLLRRNDVSYGVYIYHMPVVNVMVQYKLMFRVWHIVAALAITFMLAIASWKIVEKPALRLKRVALRGY